MTPSKETLEAASPAGDPKTAPSKPDVAHTRADAVSLDVPVKVHGSRVTDVVLGTTPHTEPFEEQTSTMIVFPQGGVLKMSTPVNVGQMVVVTNLKSNHDAICRVVKVRAFGQGLSYVEIEFTHRQAGYWGVRFASDALDGAIQPPVVAPPAPLSVEVKVEKPDDKPAPDVSWAPASSLKHPPAKPVATTNASPFAPIGSQEEVQPAAAETSSKVRIKPSAQFEALNPGLDLALKKPSVAYPSAAPASSAASLSMSELQGDAGGSTSVPFAGTGVPGDVADAAPTEAAHSSEPAASPFGRFAAEASFGDAASAREPFGSGLTGGTLGSGARSSESGERKGGKWLAIAAGVAALLAVGAGAAYRLHLPPFSSNSAKPTPMASPPAAPASESGFQPNLAYGNSNPMPGQTVQASPVNSFAPAAAPSVVAQPAQPVASKPTKPEAAAPAPADSKPAAKVPDMFGTLNAHPTSHVRSGGSQDENAAPALDVAGGADSGALPSLGASPAIAPPPPQPSEQAPVRIRVGGSIKPPRLISSTLPAYPAMARSANVEGDVVIDTTIDAAGKVTGMKVVSGSPLLRQAALEALRQWRYEPSKLNGEPVPVEMTVTIKFHNQ